MTLTPKGNPGKICHVFSDFLILPEFLPFKTLDQDRFRMDHSSLFEPEFRGRPLSQTDREMRRHKLDRQTLKPCLWIGLILKPIESILSRLLAKGKKATYIYL